MVEVLVEERSREVVLEIAVEIVKEMQKEQLNCQQKTAAAGKYTGKETEVE